MLEEIPWGFIFPLSDHDRTQRPASSQHPADAECLGAFRSILDACADPWKQAGIFPLRRVLNLLTFILFKRERQVQDEGLEDEYDEDDRYEIILKRKKAIEELAATLDEEDARKVKDDVAAVLEHETEETEEIRGEDFFVDEDLEMEEGMDDAGAPQEFEQLQDLDDILKITEPQGEMEVLLKNKEEKAQD